MANLIVFGMAVVFALIGSKQRLLKAWMILINAVFSVYIALWGADFLAGSLSLFNEKSEAYKYLCLIGGSWVVLMFVFHAAEKQLMPNPEEYSFPPFFDFLGGLLCGGAGGVVFAGTFALMLAVSPLSTRISSLPQQEIEGDMGSSHVGLQARLMSQALRKLSGIVSKTNCIIIFINQLREKVGVTYGNPEVTTGGRALKFYASVRIDVRRSEQLKNGNDVYGNRVKCKVVKNKVAPPFRTCEFDILYGKGISRAGELLDMGVNLGVVQKSGSWLSYNGDRLGQGRDNARRALEDNPALFAEIEGKIRSMGDELAEKAAEFELDEDNDGGDDLDIKLSDDE